MYRTERDNSGLLVGCFFLVALIAGVGYWVTSDRSRASRSASSDRAASACSAAQQEVCRRIEGGEAPAKVLGTVNIDEILLLLRACTACGHYERIENSVIPAGERMKDLLEKIRRKSRP